MSLNFENKIHSKHFTNKLEYYSNEKANKNEDRKKNKIDRPTIKQIVPCSTLSLPTHHNSSINIKNSDNLDIEFIKQKLLNIDQNNSDEEQSNKEIPNKARAEKLKTISKSKVLTENEYRKLYNNPFIVSVKDNNKHFISFNKTYSNFEKDKLDYVNLKRNNYDEYVSLNNYSRNQNLNHRKTTKNVYKKNKNKIKNEAERPLIKSHYSNSENQVNSNNNVKEMPNTKNYHISSSSIKDKKILKIISVSDSKKQNLLNFQKSNCIKKGFIQPNPFYKFSSCSFKKVILAYFIMLRFCLLIIWPRQNL